MKFKIYYTEKNAKNNTIDLNNHIAIYLFGIKIKKIRIDKKLHEDKKDKGNKVVNTFYIIIKQILKSLSNKEMVKVINKMIKTIKIEKLNLRLGINFQDAILNAYSIAFINTILPIVLINSYENNRDMNTSKIYYETYISKKIIDLNVECIIKFSMIKNIYSILKIILISMKGGKKNGNKTSNRIANDNINDFNRKYGRC